MKIKITMFELGYTSDLDLKRVAKFINSSKAFSAVVDESIQNIGSPDLQNIGYSVAHLSKFFRAIEDRDHLQFGIVSAPIELNYFSHTIGHSDIIVSLYLSDELCDKADITKEQYIAYTILRQGMWALYSTAEETQDKNTLFHNETRGCLFDYCWHKPDILAGLQKCSIDDICKGKLAGANIPQSVVRDIEKLLERIRQPTLLSSFVSGLHRPIFSFVFGGLVISVLVNIFSTIILDDSNNPRGYYVLGALLSVALLMVVGNYIWMLSKGKRG